MSIIAALLVTLACALPVTAQSSDETAKHRHLLPHIADGGGWRSLVLVTNVSPAASRCRLELHGSLSMNRFEAMSGITASGSTATFELPESGGYVVWGTRNESNTVSGYATLDCSAPVVAQVVFASLDRSGAVTGMATVPSSQSGTVFQIPVLTPAGTLGLAIANDTTADAFCRLVLETAQRENQGEVTLTVPSKSNLAAQLSNAISIPGGFPGGVATISCDQQVAMIGLHFELQPSGAITTFTTLPPAILDTSLQWVANWERAVLEAFYDATGGPSWSRRTNWKTSASLSSWYGVQTDAAGRVIALRLDRNGLSGTIPASLGNLPRLQRLDLSNNALSGELPSSLTNLRQLRRLKFHVNLGLCAPTTPVFTEWLAGIADFEGPACGSSVTDRVLLEAFYDATGGPNWKDNTNWKTLTPLGHWYGVETNENGRVISLELSSNGLTGTIPAVLGGLSSLERLSLWQNELTGPVPAELGRLSRLEMLILSNNQLSGPLPAELGNLSQLKELNLSFNSLSGPIPDALGNLSQLKELNLSYNSLRGPIPDALGNLANLVNLELGSNDLGGTTIPAALGRLIHLKELSIGYSNLTGRIPVELGRLTNLVSLYLPVNRLTGNIPSTLGSLSRLERLNLWVNDLIGPIPPQLGRLTRLKELHLYSNKLRGTVPAELGNLTNVRRFSVNYNRLSGELPSSLTSLQQLGYFAFVENDSLCAPSTPAFTAWRDGIPDFRGPTCGEPAPPLSQYDALMAFYWSTSGPQWKMRTNWQTRKPLSEWYGVYTDTEGRVIELQLDNNGLEGRIPASLSNLTRLRVVNLNENEISGSLPASLGSLANLDRLYLSPNKLSGEMPWSLMNLRELSVFWFHENHGLCAPMFPAFREWSRGVSDFRGPGCIFEETPESDRQALEAFYDATGGPNWKRKTNWKTAEPLSNWLGVKTDAEGRVIELRLNNIGLVGNIPAALGKLTNLEQLNLSGNELRGPVQASLGNLARLERMLLSHNKLFGLLPWSLTHLRQLRVFHFQNNVELCAPTDPQFVNWSDGIADFQGLTCGPAGTPNHPPEPRGRIGNLTLQVGGSSEDVSVGPRFHDPDGDTLTYLPRSSDTGKATAIMINRDTLRVSPVAVGTATVTVTARDPGHLSAEQSFTVTVNPAPSRNRPPVARGSIRDVTLKVGDPARRVPMAQYFHDPDGDRLTYLPSSSNPSRVTAREAPNDAIEIVPVSVGTATVTVTARDPDRLTAQQRISVRVNVRKTDPPQSTDRQILVAFFWATDGLSWNNVTNWLSDKPLDEWYGVFTDAAGRVIKLVLRGNHLRGPIPAVLGDLSHLEFLELTNNGLNGSIPSALGKLTNLKVLVLETNFLTGSIPSALGNLTNLGQLWLFSNRLTGSIPSALGNLTNLKDLWLFNNRLTGSVPSQLGNLSNLETLWLRNNSLSGELPSSLANLRKLKRLSFAVNDGLCAPSTTAFQEWLGGVEDVSGPTCSSTDPDPNPGTTRVFDGISFVWVPKGQFQMGSTSSAADEDEQPLTQVRISRGYWMGKYEVTQAQWQSVMGSNPSDNTNCGGDCPVEEVSWEDVQEFIGKLNARSGGRPYRLPTEAEWEYAARAGTTGDRYGDLDEIAWYRSNSGRTMHRVGEKAANAWGLHDMLGNVWEWVGDWYGRYPGGSVTDPTGPGSGPARVNRGGGWYAYAGDCRSADRFRNSPGSRFRSLGFRLLREE